MLHRSVFGPSPLSSRNREEGSIFNGLGEPAGKLMPSFHILSILTIYLFCTGKKLQRIMNNLILVIILHRCVNDGNKSG